MRKRKTRNKEKYIDIKVSERKLIQKKLLVRIIKIQKKKRHRFPKEP